MHRHYSDTAYTPIKPSRLNPNSNLNLNLTLSQGVNGVGVGGGPDPLGQARPSRGLPVGTVQRGTVSMPTSPDMKRMEAALSALGPGPGNEVQGNALGPLRTMPHSAHAFFNLPNQQGTNETVQSPTLPSSAAPMDISPASSALPTGPMSGWYSPPLDSPHASAIPSTQIIGPAPLPQTEARTGPGMGMDSDLDLGSSSSPLPTSVLTSAVAFGGFQRHQQQQQLNGFSRGTDELKRGGLPDDTKPGMALDTPMDLDLDIDRPYHQGPTSTTHAHGGPSQGGMDFEQQLAAGAGYDLGPGGRKKRAQVRIACTHCQKACKKCSNTRPCERCVKYGLTDCVDSSRKPRKTGIKRGPYKRRSSKFATYPYPPSMRDPNLNPDPEPAVELVSPLASEHMAYHQHAGVGSSRVQVHPSRHTRASFAHVPGTYLHLDHGGVGPDRGKARRAAAMLGPSYTTPHMGQAQSQIQSQSQGQAQGHMSAGQRSDEILHQPALSHLAQPLQITYPPFPRPLPGGQGMSNPPPTAGVPGAGSVLHKLDTGPPLSSGHGPAHSGPVAGGASDGEPGRHEQSGLAQALSTALSTPQARWINGKRLPSSSSSDSSLDGGTGQITPGHGHAQGEGRGQIASTKRRGKERPSPLYPRTPGPFPFSLGGVGDPFSRAVSPIQPEITFFPSARSVGGRTVDLKTTSTDEGVVGRALGGVAEEVEPNGYELTSSDPPEIGHSVAGQGGGDSVSGQPESSSGQPATEPNLLPDNRPSLTQNSTHTSNSSTNTGTGAYSPFPFPLPSKIRKPSLRTLVSASTSRAPSPSPAMPGSAGSGLTAGNQGEVQMRKEVQSPTLFGGAKVDMEEVGLQLSSWGGWSEGDLGLSGQAQCHTGDSGRWPSGQNGNVNGTRGGARGSGQAEEQEEREAESLFERMMGIHR